MVIAQHEQIDAEPALLHRLAQRSEGNVRAAIQSLDMVRRAQIVTVDGYAQLVGDHDPAPSLITALMVGNHDVIFSMLDDLLSRIGSPSYVMSSLVECFRDLLILKAGGRLQVTGPAFESRRELALRLESERLLFGVKTLWEVRTRLRVSDDPRGTLELALILISEAFTRGKASQEAGSSSGSHQPPANSSEKPDSAQPRKLTLAELRQRGS